MATAHDVTTMASTHAEYSPREPKVVREVLRPECVFVDVGDVRIESAGGAGHGTKVFIGGVEQRDIRSLVLRIAFDEVVTITTERIVLGK